MSDVVFQFSSDEKDVIRSVQAIGRETGKLRDQISDLAAASKTAGQQDQAIAQQRLQSLNALVGKQGELKAQAEHLKQQLADGKITAEQYGRSMGGIGKESNELREKLRHLNSQVREDSADITRAAAINRKYETSTEQVARAVAELDRLKAKGIITAERHAAAVADENSKLSTTTAEVTEETGKAEQAGGRWQKRLGGIAGATVAAAGIIKQMVSQVKELKGSMADDVSEWDKLSRAFGIQGGLSEEERRDQSRLVGQTAFDAAVPIEKAFNAAQQLSSSGFADPVKGGALNTALALIQSSNAIDQNPAEFIKGSGQFLTAFGLEKNQQNFANLGVRMQGLFKSTDVQATDLPEFAKAAPVLSNAKLSLEQSLSVLTALRETMAPGEAATGARNVVSLLQTAGAKDSTVAALKEIGLRPEDVDIQGEGLTTALNRLTKQTAGMGDAERATVLTKIFGRENVAAAQILMNSTGKLDGFGAMQRNAAVAFQKDVATARTGAFAESTRAEVWTTLDSVQDEDAVREEERRRLARVRLREDFAKRQANKGTIAGNLTAGLTAFGGFIEDNLYYPIVGESDLGAQHEYSQDQLANAGPGQRGAGVALPPELAAAIKQQNALLQRIADNQQKVKHAGNVGGRNRNQNEEAP